MIRTTIQFTAMWLTIVSAIFLIKGSLALSPQDILELSATKYGANLAVTANLAGQQADTRVGFAILVISFTLQLSVTFWEMKWGQFSTDKRGVIISLAICALIFFVGVYIGRSLKHRTMKDVTKILETRSKTGSQSRLQPTRHRST